jgi:hypothetical protein
LPRAALQSLTDLLVGLEFTSRPGEPDSFSHFDGAFIARLDTIKLQNDRDRLRPKIEATIRYEPDREKPWWADAPAKISLEADFLPTADAAHAIAISDAGLPADLDFFIARVAAVWFDENHPARSIIAIASSNGS